MNQTFSFQRFWTYFKYDLTQMWRNHSKAAILIGGASAIFYVLWVMFSLVFTQEWNTPPISARAVVFVIAFAILELYQVRTYGHLTDKKEGSAWLMIPASRTEKFISMLIVSLVVVPVLFVVVYLLIDGFLSLVDPTYGKALVTGFSGAYAQFLNALSQINNETSIQFTPSSLVFPAVVSYFCNFLYFLLCGICFKRNKLVGAIAILFGLSTVFSLLMGFVMPHVFENWPGDIDVSEDMLRGYLRNTVYIANTISCLIAVALGWGIWYRIKTLQH